VAEAAQVLGRPAFDAVARDNPVRLLPGLKE
jgi:hypothetical protein